MNWYMVTLTSRGATVAWGWMLAATDIELVDYARKMGYGIDIEYKGIADMNAVTPEIVNRGFALSDERFDTKP
jgi:hypothetical protein